MKWPWRKEPSGDHDDPPDPTFLSAEIMAERIGTASEGKAKEIYAIAKIEVDAERRRIAILDSRATALIAATSLSLTVAFSYGGSLLSEVLGKLQGRSFGIVLALYVAGLVAGLLSSGGALAAVLIRDEFPLADERAVFSTETLADTDDNFVKTMAVHFWGIQQYLVRGNIRKATRLMHAQRAFGVFLFIVGLTGLLVAATKPAHVTPNRQDKGEQDERRQQAPSQIGSTKTTDDSTGSATGTDETSSRSRRTQPTEPATRKEAITANGEQTQSLPPKDRSRKGFAEGSSKAQTKKRETSDEESGHQKGKEVR